MILKLIDRLSGLSVWLSKVALIVLTIAMLYEVVARYAFDASTIWAFDISYMATGTAFMLGVAWTARVDGHVRVDVFSSLMPQRFSRIINGVVYTAMIFPTFILMAWHGWKKAGNAFVSGEVEMVSIWAPKMWPFYAIIAYGLSLLALQVLVMGLRFLNSRNVGEVTT
uniref:TRAP transporter small permease subunit n=1 Tax=uncultured Halomonas sp. TaxID=173971 RepID=UPI002608CE0A|nr:TRAP transporter small permease subunit [uncultured Halomonas sp.]